MAPSFLSAIIPSLATSRAFIIELQTPHVESASVYQIPTHGTTLKYWHTDININESFFKSNIPVQETALSTAKA